MDLIVDSLYCGDALAARNKDLLQSKQITHVLNVSDYTVLQHTAHFQYKVVPVQDFENVDIKRHFKECIQFIADAINTGGKVLVHCYAGLSRSVTVVAAYLMQTYSMRFDDALKLIRARRTCAEPNAGFMKQLRDFERELAGRPGSMNRSSQGFNATLSRENSG